MMVTSAMPREGKTLTVTNLALTLSASYRRRVLLIDADLRRPSLHEVFRLPKTRRSERGAAIRQSASSSGALPAPEHSAGRRVGGRSVERADVRPLAGAGRTVRCRVRLGSPGCSTRWADAGRQRAGSGRQGGRFVIAAGMTPHRTVERAIAEIGRDNIVGTVLNRIDEQHLPAGGEIHRLLLSSGIFPIDPQRRLTPIATVKAAISTNRIKEVFQRDPTPHQRCQQCAQRDERNLQDAFPAAGINNDWSLFGWPLQEDLLTAYIWRDVESAVTSTNCESHGRC